MRKKIVIVTWMDGQQETYVTYGSVSTDQTGSNLLIANESYDRGIPGGELRKIPLANVRIYKIETD